MTEAGPYSELHAHSCFSLLDGVPFPAALAEQAAAYGLPALALTDHDALYGVVPFAARAKALGVRPIIGAELTIAPGDLLSGHLTLLAATQEGYRNLCRLITLARAEQPKGQAALPAAALPAHTAGLLCLSGCRQGPVAGPALAGQSERAGRALDTLGDLFGREQVYVEVQRHRRRDDLRLTHTLAALAHARRRPCVATGNVHYLKRDEAPLHDALTSLRLRVPLPQMPRAGHLRPNHEYFLRRAPEMLALYADFPEAVYNTQAVAERCQVELPSGLQVLPTFPVPAGQSALDFLRGLCAAALPRCYPAAQARPAAQALLEKELGLIDRLGLANYFLIVWDIINFCRAQRILAHGRGSAANSLVAHLLGISSVDPIAQDLVIERFLSVEHGGTPDIDLDLDAARREEVIQYVYRRWGREHAAMACTYVTYRSAGALRDAGYALGFKPETLERLGNALEAQRRAQTTDRDGRVDPPDLPVSAVADQLREQAAELATPEWQQLVRLAEQLQRRPRHLGLHSGGMIVAGAPLAELVPIEPATMEDRTVVQFDKEYLEQSGIVKIDLLGLRMLAAISDTLLFVEQVRGRRVDLERLDFKDPQVYQQICSAQTIGLFQVESGAQVSLIPHLQPRCFQDLVVEISLIRPGPLQANMVRPYLRRRQGVEPVTYPHPKLRPALESTLGILIFQEQVIKVARAAAGFSAGRGELLRRALGAKYVDETLPAFRGDFIQGALDNGLSLATAEQVWQMIASFAGYSFSEAHAAAFAVIVYWSAWLRVHYPTAYFCGLLRNAPLGTYPANVLEAEARRVGVRFLPFDANASQARAVVEPAGGAYAIRYGLDYVKGLGPERAEAVVAARGAQPFQSLADFIRRTGLDRRALENLILAGAFDQFNERRQLLWDLAAAFDLVHQPAPQLPLLLADEQAQLAPMPADERLLRTFAATGVTAGAHLTEIKRDAFAQAGCATFGELQRVRSGAKVRAGGLVADGLRRPPTAKGTSFIRLETTEGLIDVIVPVAVYAECRVALRSPFLIIDGVLRRNGPLLSLVAERVSALPIN